MGDKQVPGYREEPKVSPRSETETYAAMKLSIDNWRWPACRSICAPASACRGA